MFSVSWKETPVPSGLTPRVVSDAHDWQQPSSRPSVALPRLLPQSAAASARAYARSSAVLTNPGVRGGRGGCAASEGMCCCTKSTVD